MMKKAWLPKKHVLGLVGVAVFIAGSIVGLHLWTDMRYAQLDDEYALIEKRAENYLDKRMQRAMNTNDREAFVNAGTGEAAKQLGILWDESKKLGWEIGDFSSAGNDATISFQLGFDLRRNEASLDFQTGRFAQFFDYKIETDNPETLDQQRITRITPVTLMPWDIENGVTFVRGDNYVVFGFADEADEIKQIAPDVAFAVDGVLSSGLYKSSIATVPGFPIFYSGKSDRYQQAVSSEEVNDAHVDTSGLAVIKTGFRSSEIARQNGISIQNTSLLAYINGESAKKDTFNGGIRGVVAHEISHIGHSTYFNTAQLVKDLTGSNLAVTEGYATYMQNRVLGTLDTLRTPKIKNLVATGDLDALLSDDGVRRNLDGYTLAASYIDFMATTQSTSITKALNPAEYQGQVFTGYADSMTGDGTLGSGVKPWQRWIAQQ